MTNKEAMNKLKNIFSDVLPMGYEEPEELLLAIQALKKQIPKKPLNIRRRLGYCPKCDKATVDIFNYCYECGQKLDWGSEDDE